MAQAQARPELTLLSGTGIQPAVTGLAGGGFIVTWDRFNKSIAAKAAKANAKVDA